MSLAILRLLELLEDFLLERSSFFLIWAILSNEIGGSYGLVRSIEGKRSYFLSTDPEFRD